MQIPFDDAVLAQTLRSQLHVSPDLSSRPSAGLVSTSQDLTSERTPDDGETSTPVRPDAWPRMARRPRPAPPTTRPRITWTCASVVPTLMRPAKRYRRQIPGRLRRLSCPVSPGRRLAADGRYRGLLQEALPLGATNAVPEEPKPGFQEYVTPYLVAHEFRPREGWDIRSTGPILGMPPSEREGQVVMYYPETAEDNTSESSNDSIVYVIDQPEENRLRLDPDHRFWRVKDLVVQHAQARFVQSCQSIQKEDLEKCTPFFACPFFRNDPARYWSCLADISMVTIRGVKQHLWRHHSQPYYCPVCYEVFPRASERDIHIVKRTCEKRDMIRFDGMTPEQKTLISVGFEGYSKPEQWKGIWTLLFGKPPKKLQPFLSTGLSWKIRLVTGFWKTKGREITEQFLGNMGTAEEGFSSKGCDDAAVSVLVTVVLQDLVGLVFWRSALGLDLGIMPALEFAI